MFVVSTKRIQNRNLSVKKIILSHEDLVERDSEKIIVANAIRQRSQPPRCLDFHRPVIGSISMIDLPCEGDCQEINLSSETFQAPVRVDAADLDADGVNSIGILVNQIAFASNPRL